MIPLTSNSPLKKPLVALIKSLHGCDKVTQVKVRLSRGYVSYQAMGMDYIPDAPA